MRQHGRQIQALQAVAGLSPVSGRSRGRLKLLCAMDDYLTKPIRVEALVQALLACPTAEAP
jgi:CheY-like chemotaxis protein